LQIERAMFPDITHQPLHVSLVLHDWFVLVGMHRGYDLDCDYHTGSTLNLGFAAIVKYWNKRLLCVKHWHTIIAGFVAVNLSSHNLDGSYNVSSSQYWTILVTVEHHSSEFGSHFRCAHVVYHIDMFQVCTERIKQRKINW
jgi:hypothetical protein